MLFKNFSVSPQSNILYNVRGTNSKDGYPVHFGSWMSADKVKKMQEELLGNHEVEGILVEYQEITVFLKN